MRILGLDAGIASVGWALLEIGETDETADAETAAEESGVIAAEGQIIDCGVWMFEAAETDKEKKPKNTIRREKRGLRRVIRRRRQRMQAVRRLLFAHHLLPSAAPSALALGLDPWTLRAEALDRPLRPEELAAVLGHIARHRGFRSNAKPRAGANAASEDSKMLKAIEATRERLSQWRTIGEMFARDPAFASRKRNREGDYSRSVLRADLEKEVRQIFAAQRRLGNAHATPELEQDFTACAFFQRPLQDAESLIGFCPFLPGERRAARCSYSFERFRLLARLNTIRLIDGPTERRFTPEELAKASADFGSQKRLTWKWLRRTLGLPSSVRFEGVLPEDEGERDIVARSGNAAEGSHTIRRVIGEEAWARLCAAPESLDALAAILSFCSDLGAIRSRIEALGLPEEITARLLDAAERGEFSAFRGTGHISAAAARRLIPYLEQGLVYSEACARAGFDHAARPETALEEVRNPVVRKALGETLKQVRAIIRAYGRPDRIHLELARDLGKSEEERREITRAIEKRNRERDRLRKEFEECLGRPPSSEELLRFELWKEQGGYCLYTGREIQIQALVGSDNIVQVDHILPWSRFGDDSFRNKTLCYASANAEKRDRTPFEWFTETKTPEEWAAFEKRVMNCPEMKRGKKAHYLLRHAKEKEEAFRTRNLNDTRYLARLALDLIARHHYPEADGRRHVFARPGELTAKLRRAWGLESLKKGASGQRRSDDRHHALDAIVVAACTESMLQRLTRAAQRAERQGLARDLAGTILPPWPRFREAVGEALERVFVARAEDHRARGEAHEATIRQVREREGKVVVFERWPIDRLELKHLDRIKDAGRNAALIAALRRWIEAGKPKDDLPRSPKGDVIRKVRLQSEEKPALCLRGGTASRGEMVRVDVFREKKKGKYYLVPIYPHEIVTRTAPPDRAVAAHKEEVDWPVMDEKYEFLFSLYPQSLIKAVEPGGEEIFGYFRGIDRSTGSVKIIRPEDPNRFRRIGTRTLRSLRKFTVDRLGRIAEVEREVRTWRGAACP